MARSLVVKHTETPGTSSLLNAFLLLAVGWLVASMFFGGVSANTDVTDVNGVEFNQE